MMFAQVKKDYLDDLGDSLDLVPIGAWHGQGRKASWWSPFLLAVYDEEAGGFTGGMVACHSARVNVVLNGRSGVQSARSSVASRTRSTRRTAPSASSLPDLSARHN